MSSPRWYSVLLLAVFISAAPASAQEAAPEDVASIDAIIGASYDVISGSKDEPRDWDRERSLFHPDSRHMPTRQDESGEFVADVMPVEDFIERVDPYFSEQDFYEYEIARRVEEFGNIAHVFSTYEWSHEQGGPAGGRGINSFQLLFDGTRWWIISVFWQQESEEYPIPARYLPS